MRIDANDLNTKVKSSFLKEKSNPNEFENFSFVLQS